LFSIDQDFMIRENLLKLKERISFACAKAGVKEETVEIVAVAKGRGIMQIREALACGITDIGENRVQEAILKHKHLTPSTYNLAPIKWHMLGHLQTNKVKEAVRIFDLIQSVDSTRLAEAIDKEAGKIGKIQDILIEVKVSPEATKSGLKPEEVPEALKEISQLKNINLKGLMTIAPQTSDPEKARPFFRALRQLRDKISKLWTVDCGLWTLSMGMTDDFQVAIEEGATMIRIGRAIFEG